MPRSPTAGLSNIFLVLALPACLDYGVSGKDDDSAVDGDMDHVDTAPIDTGTVSTIEEACNGVDDDGDGTIDEGFPDADANGRVDCLDVTCPPLDLGSAGAVSVDPTCVAASVTPPANPWAWRLRYALTDNGHGVDNSITAPLVVPLFDDDGDGDIDVDDGRYIVFTGFNHIDWYGALTVVEATTGAHVWTEIGTGHAGAVSVGDLDGDGSPEILATTFDNHVKAWHADGTQMWTSAYANTVFGGTSAVVDLYGDGLPEVLAGQAVLDGATGDIVFELPSAPLDDYGHATPVDVDGDGTREILWSGSLYDADGVARWSNPQPVDGFQPAVVQADTDAAPEFVVVGQTLEVWDTDGTQLARHDLALATDIHTGPICAADLDGDGAQEIAFTRGYELLAFELDGTEMWSRPANDLGTVACSTFDLDADGAFEVFAFDASMFVVLDGATGDERLSSVHPSGTGAAFPVMADVDLDGHTELLEVGYPWAYLSSEGFVLQVWENDGDGWPASPDPWGTHDDPGTALDNSGNAPRGTEPYWLSRGVYRGRGDASTSSPDLGVAITDVCVADCTYGPVAVAIQAWNAGGADSPGDVTVDLYTVDAGVERLVGSQTLPALASGTSAVGLTFELAPTDVGDGGFVARVVGAWSAWECDTSDDEDRWEDNSCP